MHDDAALDKILSTSKRHTTNILHTGGEEMPDCGIGEWEIVGFAAKRATTSY
jgi:hypothetical protein